MWLIIQLGLAVRRRYVRCRRGAGGGRRARATAASDRPRARARRRGETGRHGVLSAGSMAMEEAR